MPRSSVTRPCGHAGVSRQEAAAGAGFVWAICWFAIAIAVPAVARGAKITLNALKRSDHGIVRSAPALILVTTLALLAAVVVHYDDANAERQTLPLGAIASIASAVVAFDFSSRHADAAREDLLSAVSGNQASVPDPIGTTVAAAQSTMSASTLSLTLPQDAADTADTTVIATRSPSPAEPAPTPQTVTVTLVSP